MLTTHERIGLLLQSWRFALIRFLPQELILIVRPSRVSWPRFLSATLAIVALNSAFAQSPLPTPRSRVVQAVDDSSRITLGGNTHPLARPEYDQGPVADSAPIRRMLLVLQRSSQQETALKQLIDQQQDESSSSFHQWLTPESFGAAFGPSEDDIAAVTAWLANQGFTSVQVNAGRTLVEFSGTAGAVRSAFHTRIHGYNIQGNTHFANASDPQIPTALAPVIAGIASLNNFPRKPASQKIGNFRHDSSGKVTRIQPRTSTAGKASSLPNFTFLEQGTPLYGVTPYDFATIYNVLPLWNSSIDGTGQTIAIVGETEINPADFVNFRKLFNLPLGNTATPTGTQYLKIIRNGPSPGITEDEGEADIDTQWSTAVAKGATIDYVVSESTEVTQGTDLSAAYIVNNNLAPVMSYSYGQCELFIGAAGNAFFNSLWQQAAAQGITVLVSSGDSGSAGCDGGSPPYATNGLAVNGLGSTPYNIAVGGTDFYMPNGGTAFWNTISDPTTQSSAKGYIPEIPWNSSCTNAAFALSQTFLAETPEQVCNNITAYNEGFLTVAGGGGGPSSCIQSDGSSLTSCRGGYPKPSWQTGSGVPLDGVRDVPDVSLFSGAGFFGAFYIVCQQSQNPDGLPCSLTAPAYDFAGYGGTSVAAPAFAGILSLVNQKTGSRQGNANYVLYSLANKQAKAGTSCNASTGTPVAGCIFNDVTTNTIAMPCLKGSPGCKQTNSAYRYGVLTGYSSTPGYDLASGLGSVNAANLVSNWSSAAFTSTSTNLTLSPLTITHGSSVAATVTVSSLSGTPTGSISINAIADNGALGSGTLSSGTYSTSLRNFPGGSYSVRAHYAGDTTYASSDSNTLSLNVSPEDSSTQLRALLYNPNNGAVTSVSNAAYGAGILLLRADVSGHSGQGIATGNITLTDSGAPLDGGVFRLNSNGYTEDQTTGLSAGTHILMATYSGDPSFNASKSGPTTLTITRASTTTSLSSSAYSLVPGGTITLSAKVLTQSFGDAAPTGLLTFKSGTTSLGTATLSGAQDPSTSLDYSSGSLAILGSQLVTGNNSVSVTYSGDTNYSPSTSTLINLAVISNGISSNSTSTLLTLSSQAIAAGSPITFTAAVTATNPRPSDPVPSGKVTFAIDGQNTSSSSILSGGKASASNTLAGISAGQHLATAIYSGDVVYGASISSTVAFTITSSLIASTVTATLSTTTAVQGTQITANVAVTPGSPTPTGTVRLQLDGNAYGASVSLANGNANLVVDTTGLQAGGHLLTVLYSGDNAHASTSSTTLVFQVIQAVGTFTLSPSTSTTTMALGKTSSAVTLTVTPSGGFNSTITFTCTGGVPSGSSCLFTSPTLQLNGTSPATTALTILSSASVDHASTTRTPRWFPIGSTATLAGLLFLTLPRRRRAGSLIVLMALTAFATMSGCGSGGVVPTGKATAPGSYAITVTASGGSTIQTAIINLSIQ
jgi:subtilase family serine protease